MHLNRTEDEYYKLSKAYLKTTATALDIDTLKDVLRYHEWKYSIQYDPVISDTDYDFLYKQLEEIERQNPGLITTDSPTQRVTSDLTENFETVEHLTPMLSLDNSYNGEDLRKFDEQIKKLAGLSSEDQISYCLEPKFDGGSVAIVYEDDKYVRAATRGNGVRGEDISLNIKTLSSVPLHVPFSKEGIFRAELRGEAVIRKTTFDQLNEVRKSKGQTLFANPRNSAAGGLRMKKPSETRDRGIEVFLYQLGYAVDQDGQDCLNRINTHQQQIELLYELGFKLEDPAELLCENIDEVIQKVVSWEEKREAYPYEIDGMVVKVNSREIQEKCGYTQHHPKWAIAYKFKAKQATTTLEQVEYQVGKIGSITPVAKVTPTKLAGVTVSSISLHNAEFISSKDLRIGDRIIIERAGDVIPYIVKSLPDLRTGKEQEIEFPKICPFDEEGRVELSQAEGEAAWRCPNCTCGKQTVQKIIFHVSKDAMDIDGFGKSYVERFFELGWVKDIADIYNLDYIAISNLEGFGSKSADKLESAINKAKENTLARLLYSLSIHHLGKKASKILAEHISSVYDLQSWTIEEFTAIKDIGPVVANNVIDFYSREENIALLQKLESFGVNVYQTEEDKPIEVAADAPLRDKTILFTGSLQEMTRNEAKKLAENMGAKNISAVSSNLDILVVGEKAGSKLKKAEAIGTVQILTESEFLALID